MDILLSLDTVQRGILQSMIEHEEHEGHERYIYVLIL